MAVKVQEGNLKVNDIIHPRFSSAPCNGVWWVRLATNGIKTASSQLNDLEAQLIDRCLLGRAECNNVGLEPALFAAARGAEEYHGFALLPIISVAASLSWLPMSQDS